MDPRDYTQEQQKDIAERVDKAQKMLTELDLRPQASISAQNTGDDVFGLKVIPYLQDLKYSPKESPIQLEDL